ncbi:MAG: cold shock domain-containing protein [Armatimonadetes bacterium]|nr:cold shock domain-containing protein [Armatimonadota bacterium]
MACGSVKWFNQVKGYGFIIPKENPGIGDIFVHVTDIKERSDRPLREGQHVHFELRQSDKGLRASDVIVHRDGNAR